MSSDFQDWWVLWPTGAAAGSHRGCQEEFKMVLDSWNTIQEHENATENRKHEEMQSLWNYSGLGIGWPQMCPSQVPTWQNSTDVWFLIHGFPFCSLVVSVDSQAEKYRLPGHAQSCRLWKLYSEGKQTGTSKSVFSLRKGFFGKQDTCWEITVKEKSQLVIHLMQTESRCSSTPISHRWLFQEVLWCKFPVWNPALTGLALSAVSSFSKELSSHCGYYDQVFKRFQYTEHWAPLKTS